MNYPQQNYPQYNQYAPKPNFDPVDYIRYNERRNLRKTSNGLGFLVLTYSLTIELMAVLTYTMMDAMNAYSSNSLSEYLLDIFVSAGSAFIPGLIYLAISRYRISDGFKKSFISPTLFIPLMLMGMAVSMIANYAASIFDINISIFGLENTAQLFEDSSMNWLESLLYLIAVSIVPAFAEEFAFRGIIMGRLRKYGDVFAILVSTVMFGAMHRNTTQIIFAFILGLVFAYIDCVTDSILPSVALHFLNNFFAVSTELFQQNTNIDERIYYIIYFSIVLLFCVSGFFSFIYLSKQHKEIFSLSSKDRSENEYSDYLTLKEKVSTFFKTPGVIISLISFTIVTIIYLIPGNVLSG